MIGWDDMDHIKDMEEQHEINKTNCTYKMNSKLRIKEASDSLGCPKEVYMRLTHLIPMVDVNGEKTSMDILHALAIVPELKAIYETEKDAKLILDLANKNSNE